MPLEYKNPEQEAPSALNSIENVDTAPSITPPHSELKSPNPNPEPNSSAAPLNDSPAPSSELAPAANEEYLRQLFGTLTPMPKTEEANKSDTPLPLLPFEQVLDKLEKKPEQSYNTDFFEKMMLSFIKESEQKRLDKCAEYMGKGGTIYVHILSLDVETNEHPKDKNGINHPITRKNFEDAAALSNERFKKLDINLKVVVIYDPDSVPLSRKEFEERKHDPAKRKKMPKGFEGEHNFMDSYLLVDAAKRKDGKGHELWLASLADNTHSDGAPKNPDEWSNIEGGGVEVGVSHTKDFLGVLNMDKQWRFYQNFVEDIKPDAEFIEILIAEALACVIEHEAMHPKLMWYSGNDSDYESKGYPNENNAKTFFERQKGKPIFRENFIGEEDGKGGHFTKTIMTNTPERGIFNQKGLGYNPYSLTSLQLMHGKNSQPFDKEAYKKNLDALRKERDKLAELLANFGKNTPDFEEKVAQYEALELQIEAYVDVLITIENRIDAEKERKFTKQMLTVTSSMLNEAKSLGEKIKGIAHPKK